MANNKVVLGNETLIDLTSDTATEETVLEGYTFHSADGQLRTGSAVAGGGDDKMDIDGSNADSAVTFADSAFTIGNRGGSYELRSSLNFTNLTTPGLNPPATSANPMQYAGNVAVLNGAIFFGKINTLYTSGNGRTWNSKSINSLSFSYCGMVAYDNKIHVLGGSGSSYQYKHWTIDANRTVQSNISSLPFAFTNGGAVVYDNKIHILGGEGSSSARLYHYSWDGTSWIQESTLPFRFNGRAVVHNNKIHILGGYDSPTSHYSWDGTSWVQESTLLSDFGYGSVLSCDGNIYILNGTDNHVYSWDGSSWAQMADPPVPYTIFMDSATIFENKIWAVFKGNTSNSYTALFYDYGSNTWYAGSFLPYNFQGGSAIVYNNKIHLLGGYGSPTRHCSYNGVSIFSESTLPYDFSYGSVVIYNNKIHILGGENSKTNHYSWDGTSWVSESTIPFNFYRGAAVVYDNKIYIMGSNDSNTKSYYWDGSSWISAGILPTYSISTSGRRSAVVYKNKIYMVTGSNGDVLIYDKTSSTWVLSKIQDERLSIRGNFYFSSSVVYNDYIYILGMSYGTGNDYYNEWCMLDGIHVIESERTTMPYNKIQNSVSIVYNNKIYTFGSSVNPFNCALFSEGERNIVQIINDKPKTLVIGNDSIANGNNSYAIGNNCVAAGNHSSAKGSNVSSFGDYSEVQGIDAESFEDYSIIYSGDNKNIPSDTMYRNRFTFGLSLKNNIITSSNGTSSSITDYGSVINGKKGYSGYIIHPTSGSSSDDLNIWIDIDLNGIYILCISSTSKLYPTNNYGAYMYMIVTGIACMVYPYTTPSTSTAAQVSYAMGYIRIDAVSDSTYQYITQVTLIRLA